MESCFCCYCCFLVQEVKWATSLTRVMAFIQPSASSISRPPYNPYPTNRSWEEASHACRQVGSSVSLPPAPVLSGSVRLHICKARPQRLALFSGTTLSQIPCCSQHPPPPQPHPSPSSFTVRNATRTFELSSWMLATRHRSHSKLQATLITLKTNLIASCPCPQFLLGPVA